MAEGNFAWRSLRADLYWSSWPNSRGVMGTSGLFRSYFAVGVSSCLGFLGMGITYGCGLCTSCCLVFLGIVMAYGFYLCVHK